MGEKKDSQKIDSPASFMKPAVSPVVTTAQALSDALVAVAAKKAELDRLAAQIQIASAAHQAAIADATKLHDEFSAHVGSLIPIGR